MARYELVEGTSRKFWEVTIAGASLTTRWGRIGSEGQVKTKKFASPAAAKKEQDKLVAEKLKKGYRSVAANRSKRAAPSKRPSPPTRDDVEDAWTRIENWFVANAPDLLKGLPGPARKADIAACERALGVTFPDDLKASLARHGAKSDWGGANIVGGWQLVGLDVIASEHGLMRKLLAEGALDAKAEPHRRITSQWWSPAWIPIVSSGSGHQICVDTAPRPGGRKGQVILFLHDDTKRFCLADSFAAWWSAIARGLERNLFGWNPAEQSFGDEAFLAIALEGRDLYRPKPKPKPKKRSR